MSNLEKDFRKEVLAAGKDLGYEPVDLPDELKHALTAFPELAVKLSKFIVKKPYDLGFLYKGKYLALELKNITDAFSFVPKNILEMPHQENGLRGVLAAGGFSGMLVRFKFALTQKQRDKYSVDSWLLDLTTYLPTAILDVHKKYTLGQLQAEGWVVPKVNGILDLSFLWTHTTPKPWAD